MRGEEGLAQQDVEESGREHVATGEDGRFVLVAVLGREVPRQGNTSESARWQALCTHWRAAVFVCCNASQHTLNQLRLQLRRELQIALPSLSRVAQKTLCAGRRSTHTQGIMLQRWKQRCVNAWGYSGRHSGTAVLVEVLVAEAGDVKLKRCTVCMDAAEPRSEGVV